jgi:hypothetical protein
VADRVALVMTRRQWLQRLRSILRSTGAWLAVGSVSPALSQPPPGDDVETLVSFAEVLVDSRLLSADTRRDLVEHLTDSAGQDPKQRELYRTTRQLLDRLAGGAFARLPLSDRVALTSRHRLEVRRLTAEESDGRISAEARDVRTRIVPELIGVCWRSPAGWDAVGYAQFPGRCGDLRRYTRAEP